MATIITREVGATAKGTTLSNAEIDNNFINLNTELSTKANTESPTFTGTVKAPKIEVTASAGDEGGEIFLAKAQTNTTLSGSGVTLDIYQNKLRIFEVGGNNRGVFIDLTSAANGVATNLLINAPIVAADVPGLDASKIISGTIDAARLPSYVDDVVEAANLAGFPATGETGKIYVALDTNKAYRWSGSAYIYITSGAVDSVAGKTGVVSLVKGDVGLGNVDNTSDANKPVSTATQTALNAKQDTLVSGTTIKTVNGVSVLGSGNIQIDGGVTSFNTRTGAVSLSSADVTTALGFTPYNSTNPNSYTSGIGTDATGDAGAISFRGGNSSSSGFGGAVTITGGTSASTSAGKNGGSVTISGGNNTSATGGFGASLQLPGGTASIGSGGQARLYSGDSKGTNIDGVDLMLFTGRGTGTGLGGTIRFYTSTATTAGTGLQTHQSRLEIDPVGQIFARANITSTSTTTGTLRVTGGVGVSGTVFAGGFNGPLTGNVTGNVSGSSGSTTGNAATATSLQTARTINGVSFNGTADITVADSTKLPLAGGTMTGAITFAAGQTWPTFNQNTTGSAGSVAWANVTGRPTAVSSFTNDSGYITSSSSISGNAATATVLQTARNINGISFNGSANIETTEWFHSDRDFPSGTLITTSINYANSEGDPFVLEISGNSYGNIIPLDILYQGYIYSNTIINHGGIANGLNISGLVALNVGGNLCFWFPSQGYWNGYNVKVYTAYATRATNRVTSITGTAKPAGTKEVALSSNIRQALHSGNFNNYSPSLTGASASGTWGISITGNAATITNQANSATTTASTGINGNQIVLRDANGYIYANHINFNTSETENPTINSFITSNGDGWSRKSSLAHVKNQIRGVADGTWGISITGSAGSAGSATNATNALRIVYDDGPRDLSNRLPNSFTRTVNFDFVGAGAGNGTGNYAGVMTFNPWSGTTASTGDSSYQLSFANQSGVNASGPPRLSIRSGIDSTWNAWHILLTSSNFSSYALPLSGGTVTGVTTFSNASDAQISLNGAGTSWAGISWTDVSGTDYTWYNGSTSTFAIGGGGSAVSGKKLHVHGGMTIGSGYASTAAPTNGLSVEGAVVSGGNTGFRNHVYYGGVRNPIWCFGDATTYGLSYFQGSSGVGGVDTIGIHPNGTATSGGSSFAVIGNGDTRAANNSYAYAFRGHSNVAGTGEASFHPAGIYSTGTNWLYGQIITNGNTINASGATCTLTATRANRANGNFYIDDNYGNGVVGVYASTRYQGVFFMGDAYKMSADGTSLANMYGIGWSHPNAGGAAGNLTDHGMLIINNGSFRCAISNSIVASANITAYSDERLKTNWRDLPENFVARLAQVKVGIYDRLDEQDVTQVGVSAQSFQQLLPQAVMTAKDEMRTLSVSYGNAALASAVELAKDNVELRARIERLEALIEQILNKE